MLTALAFDTSNYTTSAAIFDGENGHNSGKLLEVPEGALGLRQSDALFQHVKRLPDVLAQLHEEIRNAELAVIGASTRPRSVEGSYMPCFLAGECNARNLAEAMKLPFFACSHQDGHLAAAAWSAKRTDLLEGPFLAWHLSGGTTELLLVHPDGNRFRTEIIGGTQDISAGQLIDRTGQLLEIPFPSGKGLDAMSRTSAWKDYFPVKLNDLTFSFSGMENKVKKMKEEEQAPEDIARFALLTVGHTIRRVTEKARKSYPGLPVLFSGGVASNSMLREIMTEGIFAEPRYSTDNAMGVAYLAYRSLGKE